MTLLNSAPTRSPIFLTQKAKRRLNLEAQRRGLRIARSKVALGDRLTFVEYVTLVRPRYIWYKHNLVLAKQLQRVADGDLSRLMVFMPPRHGKSEEISRLFSAYYLYCHPDRFVGLNSYSAQLAFKLSLAARQNFVQGGGFLSKASSAAEHWETTDGGGLWAAGVGGSITGKGFHLGIVDDPVKNAAEARSETIRENIKEWWQSTFYTREEPGGAIIVIQTRWNEADLSGWLLTQEADEEPERWHIVNFEAIKDGEDREQVFPPTCTLEADWRKIGEALCPERYPIEKLRKLAARVGAYFFAALYQQRPAPVEGAMFKREYFRIVNAVPPGCTYVRWWDNAGTTDGDFTAGALLARDKAGHFYIVDIVRGQWVGGVRDAIKLQVAYMDRVIYGHVKIWNEIEGGSAGLDVAAATLKMFAGFSAECKHSTGSKVVRAEPLVTQCSVQNVSLVAGEWNQAFLNEAVSFPNGKNDDQVDAASAAFARLADVLDPKDLAAIMGAGLSAKASGWRNAA